MANSDRPDGFRPYGKVRDAKAYVAGGTIYPGDAVKMNNAGAVVVASASEALLGVAAEKAVSGERVLVWDDPDQMFVVQSDSGTTLAQTAVGLNYNIVATGGSTLYDRSRMELDSDSGATSSTLPLRLIAFSDQVGNAAGEHAECVVKVNLHQLRSGSEGL